MSTLSAITITASSSKQQPPMLTTSTPVPSRSNSTSSSTSSSWDVFSGHSFAGCDWPDRTRHDSYDSSPSFSSTPPSETSSDQGGFFRRLSFGSTAGPNGGSGGLLSRLLQGSAIAESSQEAVDKPMAYPKKHYDPSADPRLLSITH